MAVFLGVLLTVFKIIGVVLLILLALLILVLLTPVGMFVRYKAGILWVEALAGPLRFKVFRQRVDDLKMPELTKEETPPEKPAEQKPAQSKDGVQAGDETQAETKLPAFLQKRLDAVIALAKSDPLTLAQCALGHVGWWMNHLLRRLRIKHLTVYWTVTAEDAAATAIQYGMVMTAANNLMALLCKHMKIESDHLQIDPDFTGEHSKEHSLSFALKTRPGAMLILVLWLLCRVWNDETLQPAPAETK